MDVGDFTFLLSGPGQVLLRAAMTSYDDVPALTLNARLRRLGDGYLPAHVAAAMGQAGLRRRAVPKFGVDAARMYFTRDGLEQATAAVLAEWRAARAAAVTAGRVVDLGCGIGADLTAFAGAGLQVLGLDVDPLTASVAAANLDVLGLTGTVRAGAAEDISLDAYDLVFADPARRTGAGRVFDPRAFSPDWDFVVAMLEAARSRPGRPHVAAVKLAPGLDHAMIPTAVEAEWVSLDGDLKEAVLWSPAGSPTSRRATVLRSDGLRATVPGSPDGDPPRVRAVGGFIYEPDPAVVRAHLVSAVVAEVDGWLLDPHLAYVSADRHVVTPFARSYRVVEVLPYQEKTLRAALRARDVGALTIKKRGVEVRPEDLRRRLALRGHRPATVILTRTPGSAVALLVEPLE